MAPWANEQEFYRHLRTLPICPLCGGNGIESGGFDTSQGFDRVTSKKCWSCFGTGKDMDQEERAYFNEKAPSITKDFMETEVGKQVAAMGVQIADRAGDLGGAIGQGAKDVWGKVTSLF